MSVSVSTVAQTVPPPQSGRAGPATLQPLPPWPAQRVDPAWHHQRHITSLSSQSQVNSDWVPRSPWVVTECLTHLTQSYSLVFGGVGGDGECECSRTVTAEREWHLCFTVRGGADALLRQELVEMAKKKKWCIQSEMIISYLWMSQWTVTAHSHSLEMLS